MTALAEIISEAMIYIDDVRLNEQLDSNPALFYRRMSAYVSASMPLLSSPPELLEYIQGKYTEAQFDDFTWVSTDESVVSDVNEVSTGCIGYDLCSVVVYSDDGMYVNPYTDFTYDKETGIVTFGIQEYAGAEYEIDFYTDGSVDDLTLSMKRLFGLAISIVWNERLTNSWLDITPKIKDSAFKSQTESTYVEKMAIRKTALRQEFQDELKKYEQINAYRNVNLPYPQKRLF